MPSAAAKMAGISSASLKKNAFFSNKNFQPIQDYRYFSINGKYPLAGSHAGWIILESMVGAVLRPFVSHWGPWVHQ